VKGHPDRVLMGPGIEFDEFVLFQLHIAVDGKPEDGPKRRHRTNLATREFVAELTLTGDPNVFGPRDELQVPEIHSAVRRDNGHAQQAIGVHNHRLRHFIAWNINRLGSFGGSVDGGMDTVFVDNTMGIEKFLKSCWNRHTHLPAQILPPLGFRYKKRRQPAVLICMWSIAEIGCDLRYH
jgi:hypothetical protein